MYPNPTDKSSEIKFNLYHNENAEISITDLYGRILEVIDNLEITNQEVKQTINKNGHLSQGIYFVNIKINDATLTKKLIIQ
jgi:molecular chaperone GrpE (heat shock protein)